MSCRPRRSAGRPTSRRRTRCSLVARNQGSAQPVGSDLTVIFKSGTGFSTGGSGLAVGDALPADYSGGIVDPTAPRTRCGGTIALVLDTSGSVPDQGGDVALKNAAVGFISAFTGTPSRLTIVGLRQGGVPDVPGVRLRQLHLVAQPVRRGDGGQEPHPPDRTEDRAGPALRSDRHRHELGGRPVAALPHRCFGRPADRPRRRGVRDRRRSQPEPDLVEHR